MPWAFAGALLALLVLECGVRQLDPEDAIAYDVGARVQYDALRYHHRAAGPPEVALIGSSRGRESFSMPLMRSLVEESVGRPVRVGNYSADGASAATCQNVMRLLLRGEEAPRVVLYGVSIFQLAASEARADRSNDLWYLDDWLFDGLLAGHFEAWQILPRVLRNQLGSFYKTFAYRRRVPELIRLVTEGRERRPCPIIGQLSIQQHFEPDRSLISHPVSPERVQRYLAKRVRGDRYPLAERQENRVRRLLRWARERGVEVRIVEVPVAQILHDQLPEGAYDEFLRRFRKIAEVEGVPFVTLAELGVEFGDESFREQSHLNLAGAEVLTRAVTARILLPAMRGDPPQ
jgi:hypothetical protein